MYLAKASFSCFRFALEDAAGHFDSGGAQAGETLAADQGVGIGHGSDHAANAGGDDGIGAGRRASLVGAGFEIDVERGATGFFSRLFDGEHFGVLDAVVGVEAGADDFSIGVNQQGTDIRIR